MYLRRGMVLLRGVNRSMTSVPAAATDEPWQQAADLFVAWRHGEPRAMDDLVRLLSPILWQVARAQRLDEDAAADVVQNAWLQLVRRPESVRDPAAVGAWLVTTVRREAWRVVKADARVVCVEDDPRLETDASAEDVATQRLRDAALWSAVASLSERCQRLLRITAFIDRPNYAQLAESLGMPVGSVGPTRSRCLAKLRSVIEVQGDLRHV